MKKCFLQFCSIYDETKLFLQRSLNDGECSADWYNFQESVAHLQVLIFYIFSSSEHNPCKLLFCFSDPFLQVLEEDVVESHKNLVDSMEHWIQQDASLLAMTNEVDYDQDGEFEL